MDRRALHARRLETEALVNDFALRLQLHHALAEVLVAEVAPRDGVLVLLHLVAKVDALEVVKVKVVYV